MKLREKFPVSGKISEPLFANAVILAATYGLLFILCLKMFYSLPPEEQTWLSGLQSFADCFVTSTVTYVLATSIQNFATARTQECAYSLSVWSILISLLYLTVYAFFRPADLCVGVLLAACTVALVILATNSIVQVKETMAEGGNTTGQGKNSPSG